MFQNISMSKRLFGISVHLRDIHGYDCRLQSDKSKSNLGHRQEISLFGFTNMDFSKFNYFFKFIQHL